MASTDSLTSATSIPFADLSLRKKQDDFQAGRRRLDEFRQKKKGKKATPTPPRSALPSDVPASKGNEDGRSLQGTDGLPQQGVESKPHVSGAENGVNCSMSTKRGDESFKIPTEASDIGGFKTFMDSYKPVNGTTRSDSMVTSIGDSSQSFLHLSASHVPNAANTKTSPDLSEAALPVISGQISTLIATPYSNAFEVNRYLERGPPRSSDREPSPASRLFRVDKPEATLNSPEMHSLSLANGTEQHCIGTSRGHNASPGKLPSSRLGELASVALGSTGLGGSARKTDDVSKSDAFASVLVSNWSSSEPLLTSTATIPTESSPSLYDAWSQPSVAGSLTYPAPFLPLLPIPTSACQDSERNSPSTSSTVVVSTSLAKLAISSPSSFSSSPLRPFGPSLSQITNVTNESLQNKFVSTDGDFGSRSPWTTASAPEPSFFSHSLSSSRPSLSSFAFSDLSPRPHSSSFLQVFPSQSATVAVGDIEDLASLNIHETVEGQSVELLPASPVAAPWVHFIGQENATSNVKKSEHEEFASLEQHIEDLTREKFSLQRSLDTARTLAESLAGENTTLTKDFNNQGALVNQLKVEIERLNEEMHAREVVVEGMTAERDRARQENCSATERCQTLASEVITLENRVCRLRSHELKLEQDMEALTSNAESRKRKIASLEKDHKHLRCMVDALQEEKKVLQVRLQQAALGGTLDDAHTLSRENTAAALERDRSVADASTFTDDLAELLPAAGQGQSSHLESPSLQADQRSHNQDLGQDKGCPNLVPFEPPVLLRSPHSSLSQVPLPLSSLSRGQSSFSPMGATFVGLSSSSRVASGSLHSGGYRTLHLHAFSSSIPADVVRTISNINGSITELGEEKEALVKALKAESRGAAELRAMNSDLSQKLEAQTQRLELAISQSFAQGSRAGAGIPSKPMTAALDFVDEGDEVVDRVLGWIMHLFPGGNSRRNGIKRL